MWRGPKVLSAAFVLTMGVSLVDAQPFYLCKKFENGQCQGYCFGGSTYYCAHVGNGCDCKETLKAVEEFTKVEPMLSASFDIDGEALTTGEPDPVLSASFNIQLVGMEGGPDIFTPGNTITATQANSLIVPIHHTAGWGGGTEQVTIPAGMLSLTVEFEAWDTEVPSRLWFKVNSIAANLPSFATIALGGNQTGANVFALRGSQYTNGYIDTATGYISANIYAEFFNDVFTEEPAGVQAMIDGQFDCSGNTATFNFADAVRVVTDSPGGAKF